MKKSLFLFFFMGLMLLCISPVNAKDAFYKEWETPSSLISDLDKGYVTEDGSINPFITFRENNYEFNHGYVATKIEIEMAETERITTYLVYYDKDGKELFEEDFEFEIILNAAANGEYLYTVSVDLIEQSFILRKLDTKLNKVKELDVTDLIVVEDEEGNNNFSDILLYSMLPKFVGYNSLSITGEDVAFLYGTEEFVLTDLNLSKATVETFNNAKLRKYFPDLGLESQHIIDLQEEMENSETGLPEGIYLFTSGKGDYLASSGVKLGMNENIDLSHGFVYPLNNEGTGLDVGDIIVDNNPNANYIELDAKLGLFDKDFNKKWEVVNKDYAIFFGTKVIGNHIVTIGLNIDMPEASYEQFIKEENIIPAGIKDIGDVIKLVGINAAQNIEINTDILIYDLEGNLVQTIHGEDNLFINLHPGESGFITTNIAKINEFLANQQVNGTSAPQQIPVTMSNEVWHFDNNIETEIKGEGTVDVVESSRPGDPVTFVVQPKEGYVLSVIKVTDENGNVLTFTDNTFTMPSANVKIEVVFIKNPDTADIAIISIIVVLGIAGFIAYKNRKKISWLE